MTGHLVEGKNSVLGDFPGGPVVKNPPSNIRDVKSIPDRGTKIPHATGQLDPRAAPTKPTCSGVHNENPEQPIFFFLSVRVGIHRSQDGHHAGAVGPPSSLTTGQYLI